LCGNHIHIVKPRQMKSWEILGRFGKVWAICVISLTTLIDRGLDVPGILQKLTREAQAGKGLDRKKWSQSGHKTGERP
jgi:hypothetical protein